MTKANDPASGTQDQFVDNHDQLMNNMSNPLIAAVTISPADQATITSDNGSLHTKKTARDNAVGTAQLATKDFGNTLTNSEKNYRNIRQRIMHSPGYTRAIGELLGLERTQSTPAAEMSSDGPTPVLRGKALDTGGAEIKSNKADAEAVDLYCKRDGDADFVKLDRVLHFPYIDTRPLLVTGKPEKREYRAKFIRKNQPYGNMSLILTLIVSA